MKSAVAGLAALMLAASPALAQQAPVGAVAVATAPSDETRTLSQSGEPGLLGGIGVGTAAAIGAGLIFTIALIVVATDDDDTTTTSTTGTQR